MILEWSALALEDRVQTFEYIARDSVRAAIEVDDAVGAAAEQLVDFPHSGRSGRLAGTREIVVTGLPYILIYFVAAGRVTILRVLHGAQRWPDQ